MSYTEALDFFISALSHTNIPVVIVDSKNDTLEKIENPIWHYFNLKKEQDKYFINFLSGLSNNTFYKVYDAFLCNYIFFKLPDAEDCVVAIGPFIESFITKKSLLELAEKYGIPPKFFADFEKTFSEIAILKNDHILTVLCNTLGEKLWGGIDNFSYKKRSFSSFEENFAPDYLNFAYTNGDETSSMRTLERRYEAENKLLDAITKGTYHKAKEIISAISEFSFTERLEDSLRNAKNYCIVSNTLFRKAAERGMVHPFYIDKISSAFARNIEIMQNTSECSRLIEDMAGEYCRAVKKYSVLNYSPPVQKVITAIDWDIASDLSLKAHADALNINASYLSNIFKKETGMTLTEYVSKKRMQHACHLLTKTKLQIQTIAQHCGIFDVNYFTKTFKKHLGVTPKEYREANSK